MPLNPTMKRRLHERLHPLIGEEEADALLDEISPADPVTREWLQDRFDLITERFEQVDRRFEQVDQRFEQVDQRFEQVDQRFEQVDQRFEQVDQRFDQADQRFATKEWLEAHFYVKDHIDLKIESQDHKMEGMENRLTTAITQSEIRMTERLRQQMVLTVAGFGGAATIVSLVQAIWG